MTWEGYALGADDKRTTIKIFLTENTDGKPSGAYHQTEKQSPVP